MAEAAAPWGPDAAGDVAVAAAAPAQPAQQGAVAGHERADAAAGDDEEREDEGSDDGDDDDDSDNSDDEEGGRGSKKSKTNAGAGAGAGADVDAGAAADDDEGFGGGGKRKRTKVAASKGTPADFRKIVCDQRFQWADADKCAHYVEHNQIYCKACREYITVTTLSSAAKHFTMEAKTHKAGKDKGVVFKTKHQLKVAAVRTAAAGQAALLGGLGAAVVPRAAGAAASGPALRDHARKLRSSTVGKLMALGVVPHQIERLCSPEMAEAMQFVQQFTGLGAANTRKQDAAALYVRCIDRLHDYLKDEYFCVITDGASGKMDGGHSVSAVAVEPRASALSAHQNGLGWWLR